MTAIIWIALICVCALALMALEAIIPGISLAGIAGVILFGVAAFLCADAFGAAAAIVLMALCGALSFLIIRVIFRSVQNGRLSRTGLFVNEPVVPAVKTSAPEAEIECGSVGAASSPLHPGGIAVFHEKRIHVVSETGFIEKGEAVTVVRVEGGRVTVRRWEE